MLANNPGHRTAMGVNSRRLLNQLFSVDAAARQISGQFENQATQEEWNFTS